MISGMQAKLDARDIAGLREILHRFVSASGFVGGGHLVVLTNDLREACKRQDMAAIHAGLDDLKAEAESFLCGLETWRLKAEATHLTG